MAWFIIIQKKQRKKKEMFALVDTVSDWILTQKTQ